MTCPACGYMMTAFDKDCPRCPRVGKSVARPESTKTDQPAPVPPVAPASPASVVAEEPELRWDPPSPWKKFMMPAVCLGAAIVGGLVYGHISQPSSAAVISFQANSSSGVGDDALAELKTNGFDQCTAGDEEGCHYFMDKLRDHSDYSDSEYLKARLIVSHYLNTHEMLYQDQEAFLRNGLSAASLRGLADVAAMDGDKAAADSSIFLADTPPPSGFPALPASVPVSKPAEASPAPVPNAPASIAPAYQMTTKAGGGAPPDTSQFKDAMR